MTISPLARIAVAGVCAGLIAGCSQPGAADGTSTSPGTPTSTAPCDAAAVIAAWPLGQQVSQMLFAGVRTTADQSTLPLQQATAAADAGVGGINFLGNYPQVYSGGALSDVAAAGGDIPPFLAVDEEGGRVQRLAALGQPIPSPRVMGQTMTPEQIRATGAAVGAQLTSLGFDMDLAPVVDVSDQVDGGPIGDRSFSADAATVTADAGAFAAGLRSAGVVPVLKHFPGLGQATGNTDQTAATVPPLGALEQSDLLPYATLTKEQPVAVMMSWAVVPDLTDGQPAGLSPAAVQLLRADYAFDGVIMTDSMNAVAVTADHTVPDAAVLAVQAGVDMVLWDEATDVNDVRAAIKGAVQSGAIPQSQIVASVRRILALKGIDPCTLPTPSPTS